MRLGRYEVGRLLGEGGSGRVYEATLHGPGRFAKPVALKILREGHEELRREARIGGLLRHVHLVDVYEIGEADGVWFCAMERCALRLSDHLPLSPRAVVESGLAVCAALQYAHEELGLVHLDLKPANLLVSAEGAVKVADLGIARAEGFGGDGRIRGTPGYIAPEQAAGAAVDRRADVYALGVTLVVLATGALPSASVTVDLAGDDVVPAPSAVPAWLGPAVERCLAPDPEDRWPGMAELAQALRGLQVAGPGLREQLPAATPAARGAAPPGEDAFVGRTAERARLEGLLASPSLVTLKGPPGIGKSRLAGVAAADWRARGGLAWVADLAEARTADDLALAVARTLGKTLGKGDAIAQLGAELATRGALLLVLDDADAVGGLSDAVSLWRGRAPEARFLATSRAALGAADEEVVEVGPLSAAESEELLVARALPRGVEVARDADLAELARRLDGLPLAIELAAGRLGVLTVRDVLDRLGLSLLRRGTTDRHATLRQALDASWELLSATERAGLAQLSVFAGGFTLEAAEEVVAVEGVLDVVTGLVDRSLARAGGGRFTLLGAVQQYAAEHLADPQAAEQRHGAFFARYGAKRTLIDRDQRGNLEGVAAELDNIVVACRRAAERGDAPVAVRTVQAMWSVVHMCGPLDLGAALATRVAAIPGLTDAEQIDAFRTAGAAERARGGTRAAREHFDRARAAARRCGDLAHEAHVLGQLGNLALEEAGPAEALPHYERARAIHAELGDRAAEAMVLGNLGVTHYERGDLEASRAHYEQALALHREVGNRRLEGVVLYNLSNLLRDLGREDASLAHCEAALGVHREVGNRRSEGMALGSLAQLHADRGRLDEAVACCEASLVIHRELGNARSEGWSLDLLGQLHALRGERDAAEACYQSALALHRKVHNRREEGATLGSLGQLRREQGRTDDARALLEQALAIAIEVGSARGEAQLRERIAALGA